MNSTPRVKHHYYNHHLDSARWDCYAPREGDVIVTTSYKCGTTFTQQILYNLLIRDTHDDEVFPQIGMVSPWIDARFWPLSVEELREMIEAQTHQRFLKSHLPLDGLPYYPEARYIVVARDPRDVFMSLLNHYSAYTELAYTGLSSGEGIEPMPRYDGDDHALWQNWISRGWFEWEQEGWPFWSNMHHTRSYWDYRHLTNIMLIHYKDMTSDLPGSIRRIAEFIGRQVSGSEVDAVARAVSFERVKQQAVTESSQQDPETAFFSGGQATFINKGTNGRWRDFLTESDLELYYRTRDRVLPADCAEWLEQGGVLQGTAL